MPKPFKFERLTLTECNTLLKLAHADVNDNPEAAELTRNLIVARKAIKDSTGICLNPGCKKSFRKYKSVSGYTGKYCSSQCSSRHRQCRNKNLPMLRQEE